jgi:antitoxin (DNA-binding transcriptional repressor) of toxin-antitoxin stability system
MKTVGIFEAKTRFTSLCEEVARTGEGALVSRRGKPLVMVVPVPERTSEGGEDILTAWKRWENSHPETHEETDFPDVRSMRGRAKPNPLAES